MAWAPFNRRAESFAEALHHKPLMVHYFQYQKKIWAPFKYPLMAVKTFITLMIRRPKVVIAMTPPIFCVLFAYFYCYLFHARLVIDAHTGALISKPWIWFRSMQRFLDRHASVTIVTNRYLAELVSSWGGQPMVMNPPAIFPQGKNIKLQGRNNIMVVNTFAGDEPLAEVLLAAEQCPDIHFYITGDKTKAAHIVKKITAPNIHFTGYVSYEEYIGIMKSVNGVIGMTTRDYTLQSGGEEAVYMEKPLITTRFRFLQSYFRKGTVYADPNSQSIKNAIQVLLRDQYKLEKEMKALKSELISDWEKGINQLCEII
jgi:glycosyltransferase involved in cell wall biosynthesis